MKNLSAYIMFCFSVLLIQTQQIVQAQTKISKIDSLMRFCYENGAFNGTILVVENGEMIYHNALGFANLHSGEPLKNNSAFYLGSVSKQFTAMAIMILKEQNKLSYSDKFVKYFPEFPEYTNQITIKHLLTHTSGLTDYYELGVFRSGFTNDDVLKVMLQQPSLDFTPGEKYHYSNSAYVLLSMVVEKVSGLSFKTFMEENVFHPLGMNSTFVYDESMPKIKNRVIGYNLIGEVDDYNAFTTGGGGMYSTTRDLLLWDRALNSNKLVSQDVLDEAFTPMILNDGTASNYGHGWMIEYTGQNKSVFHTGGLAGFRTNVFKDLKNRSSITMLSNMGEANALKSISRAIQAILSNSSTNELHLPVSLKLFKLSEGNAIERVIETYHELKKTDKDGFDLSEKQLNSLGYMLLMKKRDQDAMAIFRLNFELNPKVINP